MDFHRQDSTFHSLCYTNGGELTGIGNTLFVKKKDKKEEKCFIGIVCVCVCVCVWQLQSKEACYKEI